MKPIGTKQVKEFDFPLASKAKAKSEEKREIEAQVTDPVTPEELDVDMTDYNFDWKGRSKKAQASFQKYVDLAFGNKGERPRHRIPANPEDDDLFVSNYIRESSDRIAQLEAIIEDTRMDALRDHWSMYAPINDEAALAFAHIMDKPHHALSVVNELCGKLTGVLQLEAENATFRELHVQLGCFPGSTPEEFIEAAKDLVADRGEIVEKYLILRAERDAGDKS